MRGLGSLVLLVTLGCGGPSVEADTALAREASPPVTDRDPPPYAPPARDVGTAGQAVSLRSAGGEDQARRLLTGLLEAIRDADEATLSQLFADSVSGTTPSTGVSPREPLVQRILVHARRGVLGAQSSAEELIELEALEVRRASEVFRAGALPGNVEPSDLVVEAPIREPARGALRAVLGWHLRAVLVVRPGREPRIVAL